MAQGSIILHCLSLFQRLVIHHWDTLKDGELTLENMLRIIKGHHDGVMTNVYTFEPPVEFDTHMHPFPRFEALVTGQYEINIYGETALMEAGDIIMIPVGVYHNGTFVGTEPCLFIDSYPDWAALELPEILLI